MTAAQANPLLRQAVRCLHAGQVEEAERLCRQIIETTRKSHLAWAMLGQITTARGRFEEAMSCLKRAVDLAPKETDYHVLLAEAMVTSGRPREAVARYDRALRLTRDYPPALAGKANAYTRSGKWAKARALLEPFVSRSAEDAGMATVYSRTAVHDGEFDRAVEVASRHLNDTLPTEVRRALYTDIGSAHERAERYDDAFGSFAHANEVAGGHWDPAASSERIDRVIEVFDRELLASSPEATSQARRSDVPVFIVGMMRSGSTLVEQIIDAHPETHGAGEILSLPDTIRAMSLRIGSTLPYPDCARDLDGEGLDTLADSYLAEVVALAPRARRICDKHLLNYEHLGLIQMLYPRARIIHTRRDAMDTCLSCYCSRFPPGVPAFTQDLEHLGMRFNDYQVIMEHWRSSLDMALLEIDYEALVEDQDGVSRRIIDFLGLPWDDRCLRFHESPRHVLTLSREQVNRPIYRTALGRHRHYQKHLRPLQAILETGQRGHSS